MPAIVIDTREQLPYSFDDSLSTQKQKALPAGDYSLEGHETAVAIERKRTGEMFSVVGKGRARFERELKKLSCYKYAAIVIEGKISDILNPSAFSKVSPKSVINSLISWSVQYNVHVYFAESRKFANIITLRILEKYWKHHGQQQQQQQK